MEVQVLGVLIASEIRDNATTTVLRFYFCSNLAYDVQYAMDNGYVVTTQIRQRANVNFRSHSVVRTRSSPLNKLLDSLRGNQHLIFLNLATLYRVLLRLSANFDCSDLLECIRRSLQWCRQCNQFQGTTGLAGAKCSLNGLFG